MTDEATTPELYADSTVGFTLYNVLCANTQPLSLKDMHASAVRTQHADLLEEQSARALAKLVELGRVKELEGDLFALVAQERLMVVTRDLADYDELKMTGGWEGWHVRDPRVRTGNAMRPLEAYLGRQAATRRPRAAPRTNRALGVPKESEARRTALAKQTAKRELAKAALVAHEAPPPPEPEPRQPRKGYAEHRAKQKAELAAMRALAAKTEAKR